MVYIHQYDNSVATPTHSDVDTTVIPLSTEAAPRHLDIAKIAAIDALNIGVEKILSGTEKDARTLDPLVDRLKDAGISVKEIGTDLFQAMQNNPTTTKALFAAGAFGTAYTAGTAATLGLAASTVGIAASTAGYVASNALSFVGASKTAYEFFFNGSAVLSGAGGIVYLGPSVARYVATLIAAKFRGDASKKEFEAAVVKAAVNANEPKKRPPARATSGVTHASVAADREKRGTNTALPGGLIAKALADSAPSKQLALLPKGSTGGAGTQGDLIDHIMGVPDGTNITLAGTTVVDLKNLFEAESGTADRHKIFRGTPPISHFLARALSVDVKQVKTLIEHVCWYYFTHNNTTYVAFIATLPGHTHRAEIYRWNSTLAVLTGVNDTSIFVKIGYMLTTMALRKPPGDGHRDSYTTNMIVNMVGNATENDKGRFLVDPIDDDKNSLPYRIYDLARTRDKLPPGEQLPFGEARICCTLAGGSSMTVAIKP